MNHANFWSGKALRPRRDAEGHAIVDAGILGGDGRIALDPGAAERELGPLELGLRGGIAKNRRGNVLRLGKADARHAAGGRRQHVLGIGSVPLAAGNVVEHANNDP